MDFGVGEEGGEEVDIFRNVHCRASLHEKALLRMISSSIVVRQFLPF